MEQSRHVLAVVATNAVKAGPFTTIPGYCQAFVRQVLEKTFDGKFDEYCGSSARASAFKWRDGSRDCYDVIFNPKPEDTIEGDILYKTGLPFGHVGIRVKGGPNGRVAENSSTWRGRVRGALGFRDIYDFGPIQMLVRLNDNQEV